MPILKKIILRLLLFTVLFGLYPPLILRASEPVQNWMAIDTRFTRIRYQSVASLETFQKSLKFGKGWWASTSSFSTFSDEENTKFASLKTDAIFERVQEILDMRKKIRKVTIILYPEKAALGTAYFDMYKTKTPFRAWYEFKSNTISINVMDCSEGILAHELAHSIIDNFLKVRPPQNTAEILARYVDAHLK